MSGKLADLMAHNEATAKKYYLLSEKSKMLVEVSKNLGRLIRIDDGDKDTATKETTLGEEKREFLGSEQGNSPKTTQSKRIPWTDDKLAKVTKHFKDDMLKNNLMLDVVRKGVETHKELASMSSIHTWIPGNYEMSRTI